MALTTYITDTHADETYFNAVNTVVNHLSSKYSVDSSLVHTGDFVDFKSSDDDIKKVNKRLGKFNGKVYGVLGNHDLIHDGIEEKLDNVELLEFKQKKINGLTHYGIRHHTGNGGEHAQENDYKTLEERFSEVEEKLPKSQVLLAHEGMDSFSHQEVNYHEPTSELVKKYGLEVISGHVHGTKTGAISEDSDAFGYRGCAQNDNDLFIRVGYGTQSQMYQVSNSAVREWAAELNPKGDYKSSVKESPSPELGQTKNSPKEGMGMPISPEEFQSRFKKIAPRLNPAFIEKLNSGKATRKELADLQDLIINFEDDADLAA